jgi:transposase-like protein
MSVMTAQPPLPITPEAPATLLGQAAALIEDEHGGRVFLHGNLVYAWAPGEDALRRWSAAQLARLKAAPRGQIAAAFGVDPGTLWRWEQTLTEHGTAGLASDKRGPKGPHRLTAPVIARIHALAADGDTQTAIAREVGVSTTSVRRALGMPNPDLTSAQTDHPGSGTGPDAADAADAAVADVAAAAAAEVPAPVLPVLPEPVDRGGERALARFGLIGHAPPVFAPAARVPLAGLMLALPALQATGLLDCAKRVFGALPNGFYGLESVLLEAVWRTLAGEARAEGASRIDPVAFGRVLGLDRSPEVKTIRRKLGQLAGTGQVDRLLAALAAAHLARPEAIATTTTTIGGGSDPQDAGAVPVGMLLYVDGHVRAYQGTRKVAKTHLARLRFPAPATLETWVSDAHGDPVLVVMAEPGASLAGELRRLVPQLRAAVGDERRVLVGFDRGGWSPALFAHLHARGFDVLTWRKGPAQDVAADAFTNVAFTDETGREHAWRAADTTISLPVGTTSGGGDAPTPGMHREHEHEHDRDGEGEQQVFTMRQVTLAVPATRHRRASGDEDTATRQIHILTTRTDLPTSQVIHRMGSRWRQENY